MKKRIFNPELFEVSQVRYNSTKNKNIKRADINVLLNRVKLDKKKTLKKRLIFFLTLFLFVTSLFILLYQ